MNPSRIKMGPRGSLDEFLEILRRPLRFWPWFIAVSTSEELSRLLEIKVVRLVRVSRGGSLGSTSIQDLPELNFPVEEGQFHC